MPSVPTSACCRSSSMPVSGAPATYNNGNPLGGGLASNPDDGLTKLGEQAVGLMNDLGITVDVAHVGDRTALDACRVSRAPVVVSHAGARAVWGTPRMKPDAVLDAVAGTGGVVAVSAAPNSTLSAAHPRHSLDSAMDHLTYLAERLGGEHAALGPDAFFGDHIGLYEATGHRTAWRRRRTRRCAMWPGWRTQARPPGT